MADRDRSGFTLVELLVVVVIIAMLVGLLLPAVIGARERARQTQCSNNQHELGLAVLQYEGAKHHFPGYINNFGSVGSLSWVVVILPHLGHEDLWRVWRDPSIPLSDSAGGTGKYQTAFVDLPQLKCPSDAPPEQGALSYVANCGIPDGTQTQAEYPPGSGTMVAVAEGLGHGVFHNRTVSSPITVALERIPDGAQQTLMLSENIQATQWAPSLSPTGTWTPPAEAHVGMLWTQTPGACSPINLCKEADVPAAAPDIQYARPSSNHVDGVVVTYCDGHQDFLLDGVDYEVFQRQMAPDDDKAGAGIVP